MQSYWFSKQSKINITYNISVITIIITMSIILANFGKYAISDCPFICLFVCFAFKYFDSRKCAWTCRLQNVPLYHSGSNVLKYASIIVFKWRQAIAPLSRRDTMTLLAFTLTYTSKPISHTSKPISHKCHTINYISLIHGEGMAYSVLPFPVISCPAPDVDRNYWIWNG